jgi:hypothetical protein
MPCHPFQPRDKVPAIDDVAGSRSAVWIDDLHTVEARDWAARRTAPTLLIPSDPGVGLTIGMVEQALAWARGPGRANRPPEDRPPDRNRPD